MTYLMLLVAVVAEVVGTSFLKHTEQFTKLGPTAIVALAYATAFYLLWVRLHGDALQPS